MTKKIISLNIDEDVYARFSKHCKDNGLIISKQVEIFMRGKLRNEK